MRRDALWVVLTVVGPVLWWWPVWMEPSLDLPWWLPLGVIALWTGLSTILSGGFWLRFVVACTVGTFGGLSGLAFWWPTDPIARTYLVYTVPLLTLAAMVASLVGGLAARKLSVLNEKRRRLIWLALVCCFAFGPTAIALTPPLFAHRVSRNDQLAAERFEALKTAVRQTADEAGGPAGICDGRALKQNYSGPPFSEEDWRRITGNYVRQDGYVFMVYCHEEGGYKIHAWPPFEDGKREGTRTFSFSQK